VSTLERDLESIRRTCRAASACASWRATDSCAVPLTTEHELVVQRQQSINIAVVCELEPTPVQFEASNYSHVLVSIAEINRNAFGSRIVPVLRERS
jgi:hypothetical protein